MKKITFASGLLGLIMSIGLIVGCGGDSGGSSSSEAKLDTQSIDKLGANAGELIPGCAYTSETVATTLNGHDTMATYKMVVDSLVLPKHLNQKMQKRAINESMNGSCGGTFTTIGEHDNGNDDVTYTFNNYCTGSGNDKNILNGSANVYVDGTPTDSGPVVESTTISTGKGGISATSTTDGVSSTGTIYIKKVKITKTGITADRVKVVSDEGTHTLSDASVSLGADNSSIKINSVTYTDPDVGSVTLSSSVIPLNSEDQQVSATITITGSEGSAVLSTDDVSTGLFTSKQADGSVVGGLDCSGLF